FRGAASACRSCLFFQAEDGIRDKLVTGVQTCALPISPRIHYRFWLAWKRDRTRSDSGCAASMRTSSSWVITSPVCSPAAAAGPRSEERRVGTEWGGRTAAHQRKKNRREVTYLCRAHTK